MTEPVTTIRCAICRLPACGHSDLEFAGLVPAQSHTRAPVNEQTGERS